MSGKEFVRGLTNEVRDLHPVVSELLGNLPGVREFEYHQGPNEMGADFVAETEISVLGGTEYTGLVVKSVPIKQDFSDVERQIGECFDVPRYFKNGKKEIQINRVWVLSSQTISSNAQRKISAKFKAQAVEFIDGARLASLVERFAPHLLSESPTSISVYNSSLKSKINEYEKQGSLIQNAEGSNPFVDLHIDELDPESFRGDRKKSERVDLFKEVIESSGVFVVVGDMGAGKSRLLREYALRLAGQDGWKKYKRIAVIIPFSEFRDHGNIDLQAALKKALGAAYSDVLGAGGFLVLVDGVDEAKSEHQTIDEIFSEVQRQVAVIPNCSVVFASRPLPPLRSVASSNGVREFSIRPLRARQLIELIKSACGSVSLPDRLIQDLRKSDLFKQLPQNPIAALLLSNILVEDPRDLPQSLPEIFSKAMELMLGRWDQRKGLLGQKQYETLLQVSIDLARYMMDNFLVEVAEAEFKDRIKGYLTRRKMGVDAEEIYKIAIERTGVFRLDPVSRTISFRHRSFAEYLYAQGLSSDDFTVENCLDHYWNRVNFFYFGRLKDAESLLGKVLGRVPTNDSELWERVLNVPSYMLAAYATPYEVVNRSFSSLITQAAEIYIGLRDSEENAELRGKLSELQLLWLFQFIVRDVYSYRFFSDCIPDALAEIDGEDDIGQDLKEHALFFLAIIGLDVGVTEPLEYLVEEKSFSSLPPAISLALDGEMGRGRTADDETKNRLKQLLKIHRQKRKKLLKGNSGLSDRLKAVIEVPLDRRKLSASK